MLMPGFSKFLRGEQGRSYLIGIPSTFALLLVLLGVMSGHLYLWDRTGMLVLRSPYLALACALPLVGLSIYLLRGVNLRVLLNPLGGVCGLLFLFLTDWLCRGYNFYQGPSIRGEIILATVLSWFLLSRFNKRFFNFFLIGSVIYLVGAFFVRSAGRLIWSDDHPTFIYRLSLLKEQFPNVIFFNPEWNAGLYAGDLLATGALNVFFFAAPLLAFFDVQESYNYVVLFLLFGLTPLSSYFACRLLKLPMSTAAIAAVLAFSAHLFWFKWSLKFGTLGFIISTALVPLNIAFCALVLDDERELERWHIPVFVLSFTLMLFWTPAGLALLPALFIGAAKAKKTLAKNNVKALVIFVLLVNLPWVFVLVKATNVGGFLTKGVFATEEETAVARQKVVEPPPVDSTEERGLIDPEKRGIDLRESLKIFREHSVATNPLILMLAIPGILLFAGATRLAYLFVALWLLFLGTIAAPFKPQLELSRMLVILAQVLVVPTAFSVHWLLEQARSKAEGRVGELCHRLGAAVAAGFLLVAPLSASSVIWNRSLYQYYFRSTQVDSLVSAIKEYGGDGRVMFSGFILHDLAHAHIAPLAKETGKPMLASSQVHNTWWRKEIIPESYQRRGDQGIREYIDLYNVSSIVAHEVRWKRYFANPEHGFKEVARAGKFKLFARVSDLPGYFVEGAGEVLEQKVGGVRLKLTSDEAVISFRYSPNLRVDGCQVSSAKISEEVTFTKLKGCPKEVELLLYGVPVHPWKVWH